MNYLALLLVGMPLMGQTASTSTKAAQIVLTPNATHLETLNVYGSGSLVVSCDAVVSSRTDEVVSLQSCKLSPGVSLDSAMFAIMQINHRLEEQVKQTK